jgi:molybdopterin-binding protein
VRSVRLALGLTQRELAEIVGAHSMTVSRWERGVATPNGYPARVLDMLQTAASRGAHIPVNVDRSDPMRLLAHLLTQAYSDPDLDLSLLSATNRLAGKVVQLTRGDVMSKVVIEIATGVRLTGVITTDSAIRLKLAVGSPAVAVIKATEVMVATGGSRS